MSRSGRGHDGGHLSAEDRALWEQTARSVRPLDRLKPRVHATADAASSPGRPALHNEPRVLGKPPAASPKPHPVAPHLAPHAPAHRTPPLADFDRRKARRIASGRHEIEARIDLHGMKQREAHAALRSFLRGCHESGLSTVLVITGKGAQAGDDAPRPFDLLGTPERGALKRNVPHWLAEPDLRAIVVSHRPAAIRHGGEGALYVQLRRKRPPPS